MEEGKEEGEEEGEQGRGGGRGRRGGMERDKEGGILSVLTLYPCTYSLPLTSPPATPPLPFLHPPITPTPLLPSCTLGYIPYIRLTHSLTSIVMGVAEELTTPTNFTQ